MDIIIKILQFIVSFSLLVIVHELGHFICARIFGVRVEQFQLFFGRPILSFTRGGTRYGIGWLPFGGYVKLSGMIDESMDTEQMARPVQQDEFRAKPAWQRLIIMVAGVVMNVILAFFIYVGMSYTWGDQYLSTSDMTLGYCFGEQAQSLGFRDGDKIISVNGKHYEDFNQLFQALVIQQNYIVQIERDGQIVELRTPDVSIMKILEEPDFIFPRYPFIIGELVEGHGAAAAGLQPGDRLVSLDGKPLVIFDEYVRELVAHSGQSVEIGFVRDSAGVELHKTALVDVSDKGQIGAATDALAFTPIRAHRYTLLESFPAGFKRVGTEIGGYWQQLKLIVKPKTEAYKSLGGPLSIGSIFPDQWIWERFWSITALLSIVLAVMNMLPIPGLDGGHVLFLLVEAVSGRKPGEKFMLYAQVVGMLFLVVLMVYATGNDIYRLFIK